jgi:hypothetical protein
MFKRLVKIVGLFAVLIVMLPGTSVSAATPGDPGGSPYISDLWTGPPYESLVCSPHCPQRIIVTPLPSIAGPPSLLAPNNSPAPAGSRGADLMVPTDTSKIGSGAPSGGAFTASSVGAGRPSARARAESIRGELRAVVAQLGL